MAAELAKLRSLPTPRWTAVGMLATVLLGFILLLSANSTDPQDYVDAAEFPLTFGAGIGSLVLSVWVVGVEYGQGTLRRVLTADPRRARLVRAKLATALGCAIVLTLTAWILGRLLVQLAASANDVTSVSEEIDDVAKGALFTNVVYAAVGVGVALLVRSMAGAMTIMLVLVFVVGNVIGSIDAISDISLNEAIGEVYDALADEPGDHDVGRGLFVSALWMLVVTGGGALLFSRSDVS